MQHMQLLPCTKYIQSTFVDTLKGKRKAVDVDETIGHQPKKAPLPPEVWSSRLKLLLFLVFCLSWLETRGVPCYCLVHIMVIRCHCQFVRGLEFGARSRRYDYITLLAVKKTRFWEMNGVTCYSDECDLLHSRV